ncbi:MAG: HPr family phosphocarrier protein [Geminicoccaceae bacterium]
MSADVEREAWALVTIAHPTGLHARPAVKLTRLAKGFKADVWLRPHGQEAWIDARSVVKVMGLKLRTGSAVELRAEGDEALAAVGELKALIERNFDE